MLFLLCNYDGIPPNEIPCLIRFMCCGMSYHHVSQRLKQMEIEMVNIANDSESQEGSQGDGKEDEPPMFSANAFAYEQGTVQDMYLLERYKEYFKLLAKPTTFKSLDLEENGMSATVLKKRLPSTVAIPWAFDLTCGALEKPPPMFLK